MMSDGIIYVKLQYSVLPTAYEYCPAVSLLPCCPRCPQIKRPLLGDKGRWLTTGEVAKQLTPILPLLAMMILLCFAKKPGDETTLGGSKQKRAKAVYDTVKDKRVTFRMQVVTILMDKIFVPLYEALGRQEHTQYGGKDGIVAAYQECLKTLDSMVVKTEVVKHKKNATNPAPEFFASILPKDTDADDAEGLVWQKTLEQEVCSHVATVKRQLVTRFEVVMEFQFRLANITGEIFIALVEQGAYVTVPASDAIKAARDMLLEYDGMSAEKKWGLPQEATVVFQGVLRQQLEEFSQGTINAETEHPLPLRHWEELDTHLGHFIRFRLACSAYCEGRFSIASNAARTRPNITTKTISGHVRRRSNNTATEYPSVIWFVEIDPTWTSGHPPPELKKRLTHRIVTRGRTFEEDFERLAPAAKDTLKKMNDIYEADFVASFARKNTAAEEEVAAAEDGDEQQSGNEDGDDDGSSNNSDDDAPLSDISTAPMRLGGTSGKGATDMNSRTWRRNGKAAQYDDEYGTKLAAPGPLAARNANSVWEDVENGIVVMLSKPKRKPPENSSADKAHDRPLRDFKFFTQMRVQDEFGEIYCFDLHEDKSSEMAVVYYDDNPVGDKVLWYADLIAFYTTPEGMPYVEHGYLFDKEEISADKACSKFLKDTEAGPLGTIRENELVNCTSIYHTPSACVEGKVQVHKHSEGEELPTSDLFWRRVVDLETGKEVPVVKLSKPRCL